MTKNALISFTFLLISLTGCATIGDQVANLTGDRCDIGIVLVDDSASVAGTEPYRRDQAAAAVETSLTTCDETRLAVFATNISSVDPGDVPEKVKVKSTSAAVTGAYVQALDPALAADHGPGSDIAAAVHFAGQLADGRPAKVWVVTDGMSTIPALAANPALVTDTPSAIAAVKAVMPPLDQMEITMVGVGGAASSTPTPPDVKLALSEVWKATTSEHHRGVVSDLLDESSGSADRAVDAYTSARASRTENSLGEGSWTPVATLALIPWFRRLRKSKAKNGEGWVPAGSEETQVVGNAANQADRAGSPSQLLHQLHAVRSGVRDVQHSSGRRWLATGGRARRAAAALRLIPQVDDAQSEVHRSMRAVAWREVEARVLEIRTSGAAPPKLGFWAMWSVLIGITIAETYAIFDALRNVALQRAIAISPLNPKVPDDTELLLTAALPAAGLVAIGFRLAVLADERVADSGEEAAQRPAAPIGWLQRFEAPVLIAVGVALGLFLALKRASVGGEVDTLSALLFFVIALTGIAMSFAVHRLGHSAEAEARRSVDRELRRARRAARRAAAARPLTRYYNHAAKTALHTARAQTDWDARNAVGDVGLALRAASSSDVIADFPAFVAATPPGDSGQGRAGHAYGYTDATLVPDEPRGDYRRSLTFTRWEMDETLEEILNRERALAAQALLKQLGNTPADDPVRSYLNGLVSVSSTKSDDDAGNDINITNIDVRNIEGSRPNPMRETS